MSEQKNIQNDSALEVLRKFRKILGGCKSQLRYIERECGLSGAQVLALSETCKHGPVSVAQLAHLLAIKQPTCSNLVEKLVNAGYMVRKKSAKDSRVVMLLHTAAGADLIAKISQPLEGLLPMALRELPEETLTTLDSALAQLINLM